MFTKTVVQPLFPSFIWIHDVDPGIAEPLNRRLIEVLERDYAPQAPHSPNEGWQTEQVLHERPEFRDLVEIFRTASRAILDQWELDYGSFEITGCWANVNPKGRAHTSHNHPNNFLSGVYYLQVPPGADAIDFHEPRSQVAVIRPKVTRYNVFNSIITNVEVRAGQLVVFPAWLVHSVRANPDETLRISVSFNVMFTNYIERISKPKWGGVPARQAEDSGGN